jgi:hypothetical protein
MIDPDNFEGEELDVEPYEGEPDYDGPEFEEATEGTPDGLQDDEAGLLPQDVHGFLARVSSSTRTWKETLEWLRVHNTAREIGFDPDNMCLKVTRTARNIPAKFLTAKQAQDATPSAHRITRVRDLRRGMVAYYDDPRDSNRAGHVVTLIGRVRDFDPESLHDVLCVTNTVKMNELTVVRADYFEQFWGADFQFAATILNEVELDVPNHGSKIERFHDTEPIYDLSLLMKAAQNRPKAKRILDQIQSQVNLLPDSPRLLRVREFKEQVRYEKKLNLALLSAAVDAGRTGRVMRVRDEIRRLIRELPEA